MIYLKFILNLKFRQIFIIFLLTIFYPKITQALPIIEVQTISKHQKIVSNIPAVSQLNSINSDSWDFYALTSLNNRYQCLKSDELLEDLPEVIHRDKFAILLYQCIDNIEVNNNFLAREDFLTIKRLQQNFKYPLIKLKTDIQQLDNQVNNLEQKSSFSNLELEGEAIIGLVGVSQNQDDLNLAIGTRVRLNLITSFSDRDELQVRLQGRNIPELEEVTGTKMANVGFDGQDNGDIEIDEIEYKIFVTNNTTLGLYFLGAGLGDLVPTINGLYSSSGDGAISTFGRENPIRRQIEGSAFSFSQGFGENINLTVGYVINDANETDEGLFNNSYGVISQLTFLPSDKLNFSLTYGYTRNNISTGTGSAIAEDPFPDSDNIFGHSYAAEISAWLYPNLNLGSRVGWIQAHADDLANAPKANIFTWAIMLGITDLAQEDSLLAFIFGQPPKVMQNSLGQSREDPNTAYHLEVFYRWEVIDDISLTPGFFVIFNPEHNHNRNPIFVGAIRTTFEF